MTTANEFVEKFLSHDYDPAKAHAYYLRTRELKGRATVADKAGAQAYEQHQLGNAKAKLAADLKKHPAKMNRARRITAAEQNLIRAKSLVARIKDPNVRTDMQARIADAEHKLAFVKGGGDSVTGRPKKATPAVSKANPKSKVAYNGKPLKKLGTRMEEDETPELSPSGAKLKDYNGKGLGVGTYADGWVYDARTGWSKPSKAKKA